MKPLTPAQQRVVDVMKGNGVIIMQDLVNGGFGYVGHSRYINQVVVSKMIKESIILYYKGTNAVSFYTLSPEYA